MNFRSIRRRTLYPVLLLLIVIAVVLAPRDTVEPVRDANSNISPSRENTALLPTAANVTRGASDFSLDKRQPLAEDPVDFFQAPVAESAKEPVVIPTAPPLPFEYRGKTLYGGKRKVFLVQGDKPYIAKAGDVLDGTYRIDAIEPPLLKLTYLPLAQKQVMNIGLGK